MLNDQYSKEDQYVTILNNCKEMEEKYIDMNESYKQLMNEIESYRKAIVEYRCMNKIHSEVFNSIAQKSICCLPI